MNLYQIGGAGGGGDLDIEPLAQDPALLTAMTAAAAAAAASGSGGGGGAGSTSDQSNPLGNCPVVDMNAQALLSGYKDGLSGALQLQQLQQLHAAAVAAAASSSPSSQQSQPGAAAAAAAISPTSALGQQLLQLQAASPQFGKIRQSVKTRNCPNDVLILLAAFPAAGEQGGGGGGGGGSSSNQPLNFTAADLMSSPYLQTLLASSAAAAAANGGGLAAGAAGAEPLFLENPDLPPPVVLGQVRNFVVLMCTFSPNINFKSERLFIVR